MMDWGQLDCTGGIMGWPSDAQIDAQYGYWHSPGINYNFGISNTVSDVEATKNAGTQKEMLQDLMKESINASNSQRVLENVYRQSAGVPAQATNSLSIPSQLGAGKGRGRGRGRKASLIL